jgi:hypothetical protein
MLQDKTRPAVPSNMLVRCIGLRLPDGLRADLVAQVKFETPGDKELVRLAIEQGTLPTGCVHVDRNTPSLNNTTCDRHSFVSGIGMSCCDMFLKDAVTSKTATVYDRSSCTL